MLKDDLKEIKREMPDGLEIQTGACSFCGQMGQIETLIPWDQEKVNEAVTELCDCYGAKEYARKKGQKERACKAIEGQFGQQADTEEADEPIRNLLKHIAELIVEERLDSASLDIGNGLKAKLSITSKGYIKVERQKTEKAVQEA